MKEVELTQVIVDNLDCGVASIESHEAVFLVSFIIVEELDIVDREVLRGVLVFKDLYHEIQHVHNSYTAFADNDLALQLEMNLALIVLDLLHNELDEVIVFDLVVELLAETLFSRDGGVVLLLI